MPEGISFDHRNEFFGLGVFRNQCRVCLLSICGENTVSTPTPAPRKNYFVKVRDNLGQETDRVVEMLIGLDLIPAVVVEGEIVSFGFETDAEMQAAMEPCVEQLINLE